MLGSKRRAEMSERIDQTASDVQEAAGAATVAFVLVATVALVALAVATAALLRTRQL
jgi:ABC-type spermidine/putrescine transport system permease subunit I